MDLNSCCHAFCTYFSISFLMEHILKALIPSKTILLYFTFLGHQKWCPFLFAEEVHRLSPIKFDYHYGLDAERYAFFRIPKILMTEPYFDSLSTDAKLLYGLMLDRMSLSRENGWVDEEQRVYIYFTLEDTCEYLHCKTDKAVKLFAELDMDKGFGLIKRIRQGQGKPSRIYVMRYIGLGENQTSENAKSRLRKNKSQELGG